jgi:hypothetical protein
MVGVNFTVRSALLRIPPERGVRNGAAALAVRYLSFVSAKWPFETDACFVSLSTFIFPRGLLPDNIEIGSLTGLMIVGGLKGAESFLCWES